MSKLLGANFRRLYKDPVFWLCGGAIFVYMVIYILNGGRQAMGDLAEYHRSLEDYYFQFVYLAGLFSAVFTTLFLGTEHSDGVLRNKIIAGNTRRDIYLSHLLCSYLASLVIMLCGAAGGLAGIPVLGVWTFGAADLLLYFLIIAAFLLALSAIYTLINMLCENKARSAVVTILAYFALLMLASWFYNRLEEPEMIQKYQLTVGGVLLDHIEPNPRYVDGVAREMLDFGVDLLPTGQALRLAAQNVLHPLRMLLLSLFLAVGVTFYGLFRFQKKDLK